MDTWRDLHLQTPRKDLPPDRESPSDDGDQAGDRPKGRQERHARMIPRLLEGCCAAWSGTWTLITQADAGSLRGRPETLRSPPGWKQGQPCVEPCVQLPTSA
jgi:hypothetical protein